MSLSGNTAKITELLSKINALPEAGSGGGAGGGVETCTVTINNQSDSPVAQNIGVTCSLAQSDGTFVLQREVIEGAMLDSVSKTFVVSKHSALILDGDGTVIPFSHVVTENASLLHIASVEAATNVCGIFALESDTATITFSF